MIQNPALILEQKIAEGTLSVQPNALDFTLDDLHMISYNSFSYLSNDKSKVIHKKRDQVDLVDAATANHTYQFSNQPLVHGENKGWVVLPNVQYDGMSSVYVKVPEGMCAFLIGRSTLNRNGIMMYSGLYDSGFEGNIGFILYNHNGPVFIEKGTMVGQIYFVKADDAGKYAGGYNTQKGQHWTESKVEVKVEPKIEPAVETKVEPIMAEATPVVEPVMAQAEVITAEAAPAIEATVVEPQSDPIQTATVSVETKEIPKRKPK